MTTTLADARRVFARAMAETSGIAARRKYGVLPRLIPDPCRPTSTFGPVVAIRASLARDPDRTAQFDRDFLDFAARSNSGLPGGPAEYRYNYLLVVGRKVH